MRGSRCAVVLVAVMGCGPDGRGDVVARVNGESVLRRELEARSATALARARLEEADALRAGLDALIEERLLDQEARRQGVSRGDLLRADEAGKEALLEELRRAGRVEIALAIPRVRLDPLPDDRTMGPQDAPVTIVEYLDYQCGYCRTAQPAVEELLGRHRDRVRFVVRDYLIAPGHIASARAARCAGEQGRFWEMHRSLFGPPPDLSPEATAARAAALGLDTAAFASCVASDRHDAAIAGSHESGAALGLLGTPTFFVNGERFTGILAPEAFDRIVSAELARAAR